LGEVDIHKDEGVEYLLLCECSFLVGRDGVHMLLQTVDVFVDDLYDGIMYTYRMDSTIKVSSSYVITL
jgi:hypothetical protein